MRRLFAPLLLLVFSTVSLAAQADSPQETVDRAAVAVRNVIGDADFEIARKQMKEAKAVIIVPQLVKAGFIIGGEGGHAVALSRDQEGRWSSPAFYLMAAGSIGLQIGVEAKEVVFIVRTDKGLKSLLGRGFKLGADASVAAGPIGAGVEASTAGSAQADIVAYSKSVGLFGGGALEGAVIEPKAEWNRQYYNRAVTPEDILWSRAAEAVGAAALKAELAKYSGL